jgi:hypothetical protein
VGVIETASWKNKSTVLLPWQPGQEGGILLQMFLKVAPSEKINNDFSRKMKIHHLQKLVGTPLKTLQM